MGAGCPGDNPISAILTHGLEPFPLDMCVLIELIGHDGVNELVSSNIKYWEWEKNIGIDKGRESLLKLCPQTISLASINKEFKQLLKIGRAFYSEGLSHEYIRAPYWELSLLFFNKAKAINELTGKSLEIYNKLQS